MRNMFFKFRLFILDRTVQIKDKIIKNKKIQTAKVFFFSKTAQVKNMIGMFVLEDEGIQIENFDYINNLVPEKYMNLPFSL